jgi:hypothetical protein
VSVEVDHLVKMGLHKLVKILASVLILVWKKNDRPKKENLCLAIQVTSAEWCDSGLQLLNHFCNLCPRRRLPCLVCKIVGCGKEQLVSATWMELSVAPPLKPKAERQTLSPTATMIYLRLAHPSAHCL